MNYVNARPASPTPGKPAPRRVVSADKGALVGTIRGLWPYLWPSDRADLRVRIVLATLILLVAKVVTVTVPFTFKWVTDSLVPADQEHVPIAALAAAPVALVQVRNVVGISQFCSHSTRSA